jgi:hypothetical protein
LQISSCLSRFAVTFHWDSLRVCRGSISLPISDVNFFAIVNPQIVSKLLLSSSLFPHHSLYELLTRLPVGLLLEQRDLILVGSTSASDFRFDLRPEMGLVREELTLPSLPCPDETKEPRYFAICVHPSLGASVGHLPLHVSSSPVLILRQP